MDKTKKTMELKDWAIGIGNTGNPYLSGRVLYNPEYGRDYTVSYTSPMVEYILDGDILTYETKNSIYLCNLKDMKENPFGWINHEIIKEYNEKYAAPQNEIEQIVLAETKLSARAMGIGILNHETDDFLIRILDLQRDRRLEREKEEEKLLDRIKEYLASEGLDNALYLEVLNNMEENRAIYFFGDKRGFIEPSHHVGMISDSVLYLKYPVEEDDLAIDFRYFPRGWGSMESYSWSDNIEYVVIHNSLNSAIEFNGDIVKSDETKVFTPKGHVQGLVTPDIYNGKSAFFKGIDQDE